MRASRDARAEAGRPLPYVYDLLQAAMGFGSTHIVITNADIRIAPSFDLAARVGALRPGCALIGRRVDVADPGLLTGAPYHLGYDFVAMHREDAAAIPDLGLVFGMPWWDYFLPTWIGLRGGRLIEIEPRFLFHLRHTARWEDRDWSEVGWSYNARLVDELGTATMARPAAQRFRQDRRVALKGRRAHVIHRLRRAAASLVPSQREPARVQAVERAAKVTLDFIASRTNIEGPL